jgi:hypothetical protein
MRTVAGSFMTLAFVELRIKVLALESRNRNCLTVSGLRDKAETGRLCNHYFLEYLLFMELDA